MQQPEPDRLGKRGRQWLVQIVALPFCRQHGGGFNGVILFLPGGEHLQQIDGIQPGGAAYGKRGLVFRLDLLGQTCGVGLGCGLRLEGFTLAPSVEVRFDLKGLVALSYYSAAFIGR